MIIILFNLNKINLKIMIEVKILNDSLFMIKTFIITMIVVSHIHKKDSII